ncbi:glycosyltransferase [Thermomicrobiaceae bacterium CFH 74404]|uniref:Glycosyltransferase n=1 Tax=Thermalbibacter longus TaxID=2951981 RepID=A0AA42BB72_9BACT|nr:glycosyltransferase [Thermalbibacter longus]MCM8749445.1 glycosyltransferase [Thermalbibacter longus]
MSEPLPLSVIVLTLNEERHLPGCLASVAGLARQILVVDSGSHDRTVELARAAGAEVVHRPFTGFASQRNAALELARQPWVLFLDADERVTPELAAEIRQAIDGATDATAGFWIPTQNWMFGRWIRGGGWWPDEHLRLLRAGRARYRPDVEVHEVVELSGEAGRLAYPLVHINYESYLEFLAKQARYARIRAEMLARQGRRPRRRTYLGQPARELWRRFVTLRGYRDGPTGLFLALAMAWHELHTWLLVRRLWKAASQQNPGKPDAPAGVELPDASLDLSVVIVSYNVREHVLGCLETVYASLRGSGLRGQVIVVDNASSDGTVEAVRAAFPGVEVIANRENRGFAAANNQGIRRARGRVVVLLNPDTRVAGDALGRLVHYLDENPAVGVVGPRLVYPDGRTQPSRRRFPTLLTGFLESTVVQDYWRDNRVLRRYYVADRSDAETQEVDWLVGACLAVRREAIETAGLLDERFFLYSEEVEWCWRIRRAGWRVVYLPEATVYHHESASAGQEPAARQIAFDTAKVQLYRRLHGRPAAEILRAFLLVNYLARIAIEGSKWLLGHKRALRRERIARYWRAFGSGLRPSRP